MRELSTHAFSTTMGPGVKGVGAADKSVVVVLVKKWRNDEQNFPIAKTFESILLKT